MRDSRDKAGEHEWMLDGGEASADTDTAPSSDEEPRLPTSRGVLTPAEIEALLRPDLPDDIGAAPEPSTITQRSVPQFTDAVPAADDGLRREALANAPRLSRALSQNTGLKASVTLNELQKLQSSTLEGLLVGKTGAIACFGGSDLDTSALVCLPPEVVDALIAAACGAHSSALRVGTEWTLSAMDCALLEQLLAPLAPILGDRVHLQSIETDMPYVSSLLPAGEVTVSEYSISAPDLSSDFALVQTDVERAAIREDHSVQSSKSDLPVTALVTARIASLSVPLSRLTELKAGSTLLLGLPGDQPVEVLSGDRDGPVMFEGQVGRRGNKVAVKINRKLKAGS